MLLDPIANQPLRWAAIVRTTRCGSVVVGRGQMRGATRQAASSLSNRAEMPERLPVVNSAWFASSRTMEAHSGCNDRIGSGARIRGVSAFGERATWGSERNSGSERIRCIQGASTLDGERARVHQGASASGSECIRGASAFGASAFRGRAHSGSECITHERT